MKTGNSNPRNVWKEKMALLLYFLASATLKTSKFEVGVTKQGDKTGRS